MNNPTRQIVLASGNKGKLQELQQLLQPLALSVIPQRQLHITDADETGLSFVENAILKARWAAQHSNLPAIADDSGLEVDALQGAPGIYSARFSGPAASDASNNAKLLRELRHWPDKSCSARYRCVLVFMRHPNDPTPLICQGTWEGTICYQPQGDNGFGYDPLFWLPEQQCTAAQLPPAIKNQISHRGQAMRLLAAELQALTLP